MSEVNRFSACNYTTLGHYNDVNAGTMEHARASLSQGQPRGHPGGQPRGQDVYVVPVWGAPGYDTLTHGTASGTCSGHFNISHAYGANASSCNTRFVERLCTGNLGDIKEEFSSTCIPASSPELSNRTMPDLPKLFMVQINNPIFKPNTDPEPCIDSTGKPLPSVLSFINRVGSKGGILYDQTHKTQANCEPTDTFVQCKGKLPENSPL